MASAAPSPHGFWRTIELVFRTAFRRWRTCLAISSVYAVLVGITDAVSRMSTGIVDPTTVSPSQVIAAGVAALGALFAFALVNVFVLPITLGALSLVGSAAVYGDVVDTRSVLRRALDRAMELVAVFVLTLLLLGAGPIVIGVMALLVVVVTPVVGFAVLIFGFFLLLVPLLYILVRLSLAIPVVMREQRGPIASLRRSWALVAHGWWWVFGIVVVAAGVVAVTNGAVSYVSLIGRDTTADFVIGSVVSGVGAAVSTILFGVASGVVYAMRTPEDATPPVAQVPLASAPPEATPPAPAQ